MTSQLLEGSCPTLVAPCLAALTWVLLTWTASVATFLVTRPLFLSWTDQGYGLSKVLGPLALGVLSWTVVSTGVLAWGASAATAALAVLVAAAVLTARLSPARLPPWRAVAIRDAAWLATFVLFAVVRAWHPSIIGAERPMDHALLAALLRQPHLPPTDPWLAGHSVNYHYLGYAWWAPLGQLSRAVPPVVYNLTLATLPAQTLAAAWSLGARLGPALPWCGGLVLLAASPVGAWIWLRETWHGTFFPATRLIPGTINEFPLFSFVWGDLHPHVIALPLLVALVGLLVRLDELTRPDARPDARVVLPVTLLVAVVGAASVLTSNWDVAPVGLAALGVAWMLRTLPRRVRWTALGLSLAAAAAMVVPVLRHFKHPDVPVGWEWTGSPLGAFLQVQGIWLLPVALVCLRQRRGARLALAAAVVMATAVLAPGWAVRVLLLALVAGVWSQRLTLGRATTGLVLAALCLLLAAESIWVDDVYGWDGRRMNVVFKWHLHAITVLACALPGVVAGLAIDLRRRGALALVVVALVALVPSMTLVAARFRHREPVVTLDGLAGMARHHPGDAAAVVYLWTHAAGDEVVLEAAGTAYTYASRISTMTGQPTVLGWEAHERLWRRGDVWDADIRSRAALVDALYGGPADGLGDRLRHAGVRWAVVGAVERRRYPGVTAARFAEVAQVVVDEEGTVLLRVD